MNHSSSLFSFFDTLWNLSGRVFSSPCAVSVQSFLLSDQEVVYFSIVFSSFDSRNSLQYTSKLLAFECSK